MCRKQAFSLVELLVVVAIISVLAALLLPSLGKAVESSRAIHCLNSTRQIGLSTLQYTNEANGWTIPTNITINSCNPKGIRGIRGFMGLLSYLNYLPGKKISFTWYAGEETVPNYGPPYDVLHCCPSLPAKGSLHPFQFSTYGMRYPNA